MRLERHHNFGPRLRRLVAALSEWVPSSSDERAIYRVLGGAVYALHLANRLPESTRRRGDLDENRVIIKAIQTDQGPPAWWLYPYHMKNASMRAALTFARVSRSLGADTRLNEQMRRTLSHFYDHMDTAPNKPADPNDLLALLEDMFLQYMNRNRGEDSQDSLVWHG